MAYGGDLQANTAVDLMVGPFLDETTGKDAETGLTITQSEVRLSKNGANMAQKNEATSLTHDELGNYVCKLNTTDTNTEGILTLMIHESGALPIKMDYTVLAQAAYISKYTAKDTGFMGVDIAAISADTTAADNLELFTEVLENGTGLIDTGTFKAGAINAAALGADAITAAKIADDAIAAEHLAAGAIVAATFAANAITSTVVADNTITAAKLNADCITNAKIADDAIAAENLATDAISADALSAGAVNEIWAKAMSDLAGIPAFNASVLDAINVMFMALRNKQTATDAQQTIGNNAGATIATAVLSDAAGTTTKEEYA